MTVFVQTNVGIWIDGFAIHGFANELSLMASGDVKEATTFASNGWKNRKVGLGQHDATVKGFQDYATTGVDPTFPVTGLGGYNVFSVAPQNYGATVADPIFFGQGRLNKYTPLTAPVGEMAMFDFGWVGDAQLVRGQVLHPQAARTATGNGTTTTFTPPTATQSLWAAFHVLAVSGAGTITFKVQTDDNSGMTTPTDRITTAAVTAVGGVFSSVAGSLAGETHIRVTYTITGFTSVTFLASAGVL